MEKININDRRVIDGPNDKLMQVAPVKHPKAMDIFHKMVADNWVAGEVDLSMDVADWDKITDGQKRAYTKALAFLSNLDGLQLNNLVTNVASRVTSPEYQMALSRQIYEEALHVWSYSTLIETMRLDPIEIYNMFMTDHILAAKNQFVTELNESFEKQPNEQFPLIMVANQCLEGIMFQTGFLVFYAIAEVGIMRGSAKMIRFIDRDEANHLRMFFSMYQDCKDERPELFESEEYRDRAVNIIKMFAELEMSWGKHIIEGGVLGLTEEIINDYVAYLANTYAKGLGLDQPYEDVANPVEWVEDRKKEHGIETNFFEDNVAEYDTGTLDW